MIEYLNYDECGRDLSLSDAKRLLGLGRVLVDSDNDLWRQVDGVLQFAFRDDVDFVEWRGGGLSHVDVRFRQCCPARRTKPVKSYTVEEAVDTYSFDDYETEIAYLKHKDGQHIPLAIAALGVAGEAGEVADLVKKVVWHGKELDRDALVKELGDVLWYLSAICSSEGITLAEVAEANVAKLRARYPDGFVEGGGVR